MSTTGGQPRAREATARWIVEGRQFDLICVDGSNTLGDAMCDLLLADRLLPPGGWLIMDDAVNKDYPGVRGQGCRGVRAQGQPADVGRG